MVFQSKEVYHHVKVPGTLWINNLWNIKNILQFHLVYSSKQTMKTIRQIQFLQTIEGTYNNWIKIQGVHEIFDLHSHRVITRWKIIEIPINKEIIKHVD